MRAWAVDLIAAWRGEPLALSSPMPLEVARRWLSGTDDGAGDVIRRAAASLNNRSPWRPVLRGRLRQSGSGSTFVGVLGWAPVLKIWTGGVLVAFAGALLTGVVV